MSRKGPGACHCLTQTPIYCSNPITQEDLLCDDCRDGCNAVAMPTRVLELIGDGFHRHFATGAHLKVKINVSGGIKHDL